MLLLEARTETCKAARDAEKKLQAEACMHNEAMAAAQQTAERLEQQARQDEQTKQLQEGHILKLTQELVSR